MNSICITPEDPTSYDAALLMDELSDCLMTITGDSGKNSFRVEDVCNNRSLFVVARDQDGTAVGCGAFRPIDNNTAEIKRMYAKNKGLGTGKKILSYLESQAFKMGYSAIFLETRLVNHQAVLFYQHNGYIQIPNYGKYMNNDKAICFKKLLVGTNHEQDF